MLALSVVLLCAPPATATFAGENGKLAYQRGGNISTVNPDGTGEIAFPAGAFPRSTPMWSADGQHIAADLFKGCDPFTESCRYDLATYDADGSNEQEVPLTRGGRYPSWSPDGSKLVYRYDATPIASEFDGVWTVRTDATDNQKLDESNGTAGWFPKWSPEGTRIAGTVSVQCLTIDQGCIEFSLQSTDPVSWSPDGSRVALSRSVGGNVDVYVRHPDGTLEQLTTSPASDRSPAWSPDGTKLAFISTRDGDSALYTMNSDGTSQARVPAIAGGVVAVDWQPVPVNDASGYPRPKGASPMRLSLVPAFEQCTAPNEEHGPPLAFGSCSPPTRSSSRLVVGATDNLPAPNESVGSVRVDVIPGIPGPPDDAEVHINFNLTNVMYAADFSDYNGELKVVFDVTPTDKDSGAGSTSAYEFPLELKVQCNPTADTTIGATCLASTTVDALVPGVIEDGARTVWAIDQLRVRDGGNDGDVDTVPNFPFMTQGLFVP